MKMMTQCEKCGERVGYEIDPFVAVRAMTLEECEAVVGEFVNYRHMDGYLVGSTMLTTGAGDSEQLHAARLAVLCKLFWEGKNAHDTEVNG